MLLALGAVPLTGCGMAPSGTTTTAGQVDGAPALLDLNSVAGGQVRRIDALPVTPVQFGQESADRAESQSQPRPPQLSAIPSDDLPDGPNADVELTTTDICRGGECGRVASDELHPTVEPLPACEPAQPEAPEAIASDDYKEMITKSAASDIVYSNYFTGIHGNYLKGSIVNAGMDPDHLPEADPSKMDFDKATTGAKAWKDIWGAGQGIGAVKSVVPAADLVDRLSAEYKVAKAELCSRA